MTLIQKIGTYNSVEGSVLSKNCMIKFEVGNSHCLFCRQIVYTEQELLHCIHQIQACLPWGWTTRSWHTIPSILQVKSVRILKKKKKKALTTAFSQTWLHTCCAFWGLCKTICYGVFNNIKSHFNSSKLNPKCTTKTLEQAVL